MTARHVPEAAGPVPAAPRLSYLVFRLERRIRARLDAALASHGVTTTEYMTLSELRLRDGPSSAQLARIAFVSPQAMNLVIRDLERRGLIHREPDSDGGRVLRASLTRAGLATLLRCDQALDDIEQTMLCDLGEEDHEVLAGYLTACAQALHSRPDPVRAPSGVRPLVTWQQATHESSRIEPGAVT